MATMKFGNLTTNQIKDICSKNVCTEDGFKKSCPIYDEKAEICTCNLIFGKDPVFLVSPSSYRNEVLDRNITIK